ncbi:MAG: hypothetical protein AMJ42_03195 [Deltaproteobacteria bacterium DG_8]|nr:MAG: hypothetical protein AMJ42_03195 [Deltaproteobacteria bacterium DG_8]
MLRDLNRFVAHSKRGVISIETFPIQIISNLLDGKAGVSPPSGREEGESFAGVFTGLASVKASNQSKSRKGIEGFEEGKVCSLHVLGDNSPAANLLGVSGNLVSHPKSQPQMISESLQATLNRNPELSAQMMEIWEEKGISSSLKDILPQLGFTQEEIDSFTGAKDLGQVKGLLLKLGLSLSEAEQFVKGDSNALRSEEGLFIFNKLINVLEQEGIPPSQAREISKMLVGLKMELLHVDKPIAGEGHPQYEIKNLLLQLGIHPEDVDRMIKEGENPFDRLSKILLKLGMSTEEVHKLVEAEKVPIQNLKTFLIKMGVNPEEVGKLIEMGKHSAEKMSLKQLITLYFQENDGKELSHLSGEDDSSTGTNNKSQNSQGKVDLNSRGQIDINSIVSREAEGGKAQVDFEQVMSKMVSRESTTQKVMEQIVKGAKIQVESGQTRARISLHPPTLGKLHMHIITKENQVRATFFAETSQVKEIIESNLPQLRQSFLQQGLKVEHFNVFVGYHPSDNQTDKHSFFDLDKSHRLEREGLDGEDSLTMEKTVKRAIGNHMVDLFV